MTRLRHTASPRHAEVRRQTTDDPSAPYGFAAVREARLQMTRLRHTASPRHAEVR
jgi:hypothetical protein